MRVLLLPALALQILFFSACESPSNHAVDTGKPDSIAVQPNALDSAGLHLVSGKWKGPFEETLLLKEDGTYHWQLDREAIACEKGTFSVSGTDVVFTHVENCDASEGRSNLILGNAKCSCEKTKSDPEYREILSCESGGRRFQFGNAAMPTRPGDSVLIQNVRCTVLASSGMATQEVRLRSASSPDSAVVIIEDLVTGETRDKLRKGEKFRILAETQALYRISAWENHWYYIHVNDFTGNAWVFGRYITVEK
jgi:hypothetical protein